MCNETTFIDIGDGDKGVYVCDNCGAFSHPAARIKHHNTCVPGESKHWENEYKKMHEESKQEGLVTAFLNHYINCLRHVQKKY